MFVVCPRPMFIPAWVGTSGNACQTRRKAASITILPSQGRWQREQETRGGRKECTSTHRLQLLSIEEAIKLWEEKRAVCTLIKPYHLTASEMSGCPSAEPAGSRDEGGQKRCRSCVLGNARALPCSRSGLRTLHEITSPWCCPESKERGPFSASFQIALRNVQTANQFDYTEILESANYLVKWCV